MADISSISGSGNPYATGNYTLENDKNKLSMTDYFYLLAVQMQNQDMTNPMDSSEMMSQLTQMGMMQAINDMTEAAQLSNALSTSQYAMSMAGQEITLAVMKKNAYGVEVPVDVKYGKVVCVDLTSGTPTLRIEGDDTVYSLSQVLGIGKLDNPYKTDADIDTDTDTDADTDTDISTDTVINPDTDTVTDSDPDTDPDTDTVIGPDPDTDTVTGPDPDTVSYTHLCKRVTKNTWTDTNYPELDWTPRMYYRWGNIYTTNSGRSIRVAD